MANQFLSEWNPVTLRDTIPLLSVLVALAAVVIGPCISLKVAKRQAETSREIATLQARTGVLSKNRQDWINSLRNEIAGFLSSVTAINLELSKDPPVFSSEFYKHATQMRLHYAKTQLHINPKESEHKDLVDKMHAVMDCCLTFDTQQKSGELNKLSNELVEISQRILKSEWIRVKTFS